MSTREERELLLLSRLNDLDELIMQFAPFTLTDYYFLKITKKMEHFVRACCKETVPTLNTNKKHKSIITPFLKGR